MSEPKVATREAALRIHAATRLRRAQILFDGAVNHAKAILGRRDTEALLASWRDMREPSRE